MHGDLWLRFAKITMLVLLRAEFADKRTYLCDANDHVSNMRFERVNRASLFVATEPDSDADEGSISLLGGLLHLLELTSNVGVVLGNRASLALDSNFPCIHSALN